MDGTLLNTRHQITPRTRAALAHLHERGVPFVIISARSPHRLGQLSVVKSSDILLEIMADGITKATAVQTLCGLWQADPRDCYAFGDNYNDAEMLALVGHPFLMGNTPAPLKTRISSHTADNDHDGIAVPLEGAGMV